MNIALVFGGCHRRGGVERSVWEMAKHLSARHSVCVYAHDIETEGLEKVHQVPIELKGPRTLRPLEFARAARLSLMGTTHDHVISFGVGDVKADVLWVNSVHRAWLRKGLGFSGGSGIQRLPALRYASPRHQLLLWMEWNYFARGHPVAVVNVADAVGHDVHRLYGVPREIMTTIHNGFSPDEFSPERRKRLRIAARAEFGYSDGDVVALIAANELGRKGFDVLVEAQAILGDQQLQVLLVGRQPLTPAYERRLVELGVADRVKYAGSRSDMGRMHAVADLFVLPTQYEAFALSIIEALASGLPVITTKVPGAGDRVVDMHNGRLLNDPRSSNELADLLGQAMVSDVRTLWADNAAQSVADLSWSALFDKAERLLDSLPSRNLGAAPPGDHLVTDT